jgi:hypothetical protein
MALADGPIRRKDSMRMDRRWPLVAALTALVSAGAMLAASPVQADPLGGGGGNYPTVGSATTQDLMNGLATQVHLGGPFSPLAIASYDVSPQPTTIMPGGFVSFPRPEDDGEGAAALRAAENGTVYAARGIASTGPLSTSDVAFSRISVGPRFPTLVDPYVWVPYAIDGVTYATHASSAITNLTTSDLQAIYAAANGATVSLSIGARKIGTQGTPGVDIVPLLPEAGSGTREFWVSRYLGVTPGSATADTYTDGSGTHDVLEDDGSALAAVPLGILPFSVGDWIGQSQAPVLSSAYGITVIDRRGSSVLGGIDSTSPTTLTAGGGVALDTGFAVLRPLFNLVKHDRIDPSSGAYDATLAAVLSGPTAKVGTQPGFFTPTVVEDFGFAPLSGTPRFINGVPYTLGQTTIHGVL